MLFKRIAEDPHQDLRQAEESLPRLAANLIERDIFSWFQDASPTISGAIREMAVRMELADVEGAKRHVLKRVYQTLVPTKLRKALGEFHTKDWTAELVPQEIGYNGQGFLLDPACGSGSFLSLTIQRRNQTLSKLSALRAAYRDIALYLQASVIPMHVADPHLGAQRRPLLVEASVYFVTTGNKEQAFFVSALLNSGPPSKLRPGPYASGARSELRTVQEVDDWCLTNP